MKSNNEVLNILALVDREKKYGVARRLRITIMIYANSERRRKIPLLSKFLLNQYKCRYLYLRA